MTSDQIESLPSVRARVLQIAGTRDPVMSWKGARWLAERLQDTRLVEIEDCGHFPMLEAPDRFDSALTEFLAAPGA